MHSPAVISPTRPALSGRAVPNARGTSRTVACTIVNAAVYVASVLVLLRLSPEAPAWISGSLIYPLDDTYIHLALARTLVETGTWGVFPNVQAGASSSPLWTLLLAAAALLPASRASMTWVPVGLNVALGLLLIALLSRRFATREQGPWVVLLAVMVIPLAPLSYVGMEHVLHVLLVVALTWTCLDATEAAERPSRRTLVVLAALSALAVAARYESLFVAAPLGVVAIWRRRPLVLGALGLGAALAVVGFGTFWVWQGGFFLPNSLLLKAAGGNGVALSDKLLQVFTNLRTNLTSPLSRYLAFGLAVAGGAALLGARRHLSLIFVAAAATAAHLALASLGWLYRYEAYLVGLIFVAGATALIDATERKKPGPALAVAVLAALLWPRAADMTVETVRAAEDRVWEHVDVARMLDRLPDETILVNDIGIPAYFGRSKLYDVYGLAANEPVRLRRENGYPAEAVEALAGRVGAGSAALQICWPDVARRLPGNWRMVGLWRGPRNVVFGDFWVGFFALNDDAARSLERALAAEAPRSGVASYDGASQEVRRYNASVDKVSATTELCRR